MTFTPANDYDVYRLTARRTLVEPGSLDTPTFAGRNVLVTGGTGSIGAHLLGELLRYGPKRLVGVGSTPPWLRHDGVEYEFCDLREPQQVTALFDDVRPDVVIHLAAMHDVGFAEWNPRMAVATNVGGLQHVLDACDRRPPAVLVHASTGKCVRWYSPDMYATTKRIDEWLLGEWARQHPHTAVAAGRFTHVVDNGVVQKRFQRAINAGLPLRVYNAGYPFYVQSAIESAQLLAFLATLPSRGVLRVGAINDLGWPVSADGLAEAMVAEGPLSSEIRRVDAEAGYFVGAWPGFFDPAVSGSLSPLINAPEMHAATHEGDDLARRVDVIELRPPSDTTSTGVARIATQVASGSTDDVRAAVFATADAVLTEATASLPLPTVRRALDLAGDDTSRFEPAVRTIHETFSQRLATEEKQ